MEVIKHGNFYKEDRKIQCICGCEFECEQEDIQTDYSIFSLEYEPGPRKYKRYVVCPECNARTDIGKTYEYSNLNAATPYKPYEYFGEE